MTRMKHSSIGILAWEPRHCLDNPALRMHLCSQMAITIPRRKPDLIPNITKKMRMGSPMRSTRRHQCSQSIISIIKRSSRRSSRQRVSITSNLTLFIKLEWVMSDLLMTEDIELKGRGGLSYPVSFYMMWSVPDQPSNDLSRCS
jgi:hypothetical protein